MPRFLAERPSRVDIAPQGLHRARLHSTGRQTSLQIAPRSRDTPPHPAMAQVFAQSAFVQRGAQRAFLPRTATHSRTAKMAARALTQDELKQQARASARMHLGAAPPRRCPTSALLHIPPFRASRDPSLAPAGRLEGRGIRQVWHGGGPGHWLHCRLCGRPHRPAAQGGQAQGHHRRAHLHSHL